MPRRAARKDTTHNEISDGLREHGVIVIDTHRAGYGAPDALCYYAATDTWKPMEFKTQRYQKQYKTKRNPEGGDGLVQLKPAQEKLQKVAPIPIVRTLAEALALFGIEPKS